MMLFLRALHARYGNLLTQFASKHKDLSTALIDSVISDAKFMDSSQWWVLVASRSRVTRLPLLAPLRLHQW